MSRCDVCGRDLDTGEACQRKVSYLGSTCSAECMQALDARARRLHAELLEEPLEQIPAELAVPDFERWTLKLAVHFLQVAEVEGWIEQLPRALRKPEIMALEVKKQIVGKLPKEYVSVERNPSLIGPDYFYTFRRPIPGQAILDAVVGAGILKFSIG